MSTRTPKLPTALSPSSLDLYAQCPRRYEEEKIKGLYSPPGKEAVLGTFVHLILEKLMQQDPERRLLDVAKLNAREAWEETLGDSQFKSLNLSDDEQFDFRWSAWRSVENYFAMEDPTTVNVVATERNVNTTIDGVPLRGIIDRLDETEGMLILSDYKNGKVTDAKYMGPKVAQLNLYAAMVHAIEDRKPSTARLIYTAHSKIVDVPLTDGGIKKTLTKAKKTWDSIHECFSSSDYATGLSTFKPKTSPLCGWCPVLEKCPEGMANVSMLKRMGRLRTDAPGYSVVSSRPSGPTESPSERAVIVQKVPRRKSR